VARLIAGSEHVLTIGGDHAVTYPLLRATAAAYGPLSVVHVDAHPDLYLDYGGNRYSHASPFRRALEDGCIAELVQVGVRSATPDERAAAQEYGVKQYPARALGRIPTLRMTRSLYVSIDLDGLDPAFAPGVSHPVPGGLSLREVLQLLDRIRAPRWVGADVVEFNPRADATGVTAVVGARLVKELALLLHRHS
jgi:agmatinase